MTPVRLKNCFKAHPAALLGLALALVTLAVFGRTWNFEFVNYDDPAMVVTNPIVTGGLSLHGIRWALTTSFYEYWHPLTWLSHELDCSLFGLWAGGHHLVSAILHTLNVVLLFAAFRRMTGALWRSAMVAALFALHPLHVESVAWIAERKDVLSGFFFILALWAYAGYARREIPNPESEGQRRAWTSFYYWLSLASFACGLMSKPMVVTLPFVLLLLDYWPLRRLELPTINRQLGALVREKLPFFGLVLVGCGITYSSVVSGGNVISAETLPWSFRLANVPMAYARYLAKTIWPAHLAALYPLPGHWAWWQVGVALLLLTLISILVAVRARSAPYLVFGWLTFLGMIVPTVGFVSVGFLSMADRYMYLPAIGLFAALVWAVGDLSVRWKSRNLCLSALAGLALVLCGSLTWTQVRCWKDSFSLWTHCLAVNPDNATAHYDLAYALHGSGKLDEAISHYQEAVRLDPDFLNAYNGLGAAFAASGRLRQATNCFARVLKTAPNFVTTRDNLARALLDLGDAHGALAQAAEAARLDPGDSQAQTYMGRALSAQNQAEQARHCFTEALHLNPACTEAQYCMGLEWLKTGRFELAVACLDKTVQLDPSATEARCQLGVALAGAGDAARAITQYQQVLRLAPTSVVALNNLAWILATDPKASLRNGTEAVRLAESACQRVSPAQPPLLITLAAAYAEAGRFAEAIITAQKAYDLASAAGQTNHLERAQALLRQFRNSRPFRRESR